jgi:hypothetical protein
VQQSWLKADLLVDKPIRAEVLRNDVNGLLNRAATDDFTVAGAAPRGHRLARRAWRAAKIGPAGGGGLGLRAQELAASKTHNPARTRSVTRAFASAGETTRMNLLGSGRWDSLPLGTSLAGGRSLLCPSCCLDLCVLCLSEF